MFVFGFGLPGTLVLFGVAVSMGFVLQFWAVLVLSCGALTSQLVRASGLVRACCCWRFP